MEIHAVVYLNNRKSINIKIKAREDSYEKIPIMAHTASVIVGDTLPTLNVDVAVCSNFNRTAMEVAEDIGAGWNFGNGFEAYDLTGGNEYVWEFSFAGVLASCGFDTRSCSGKDNRAAARFPLVRITF